MISNNTEPTKLEITAVGIYATGTALLYTDTIRSLLSPLLSSLIAILDSTMSEDTRTVLSTGISYGILLPFLAILTKTQYSSYRRTIVEYNLEHDKDVDRGTGKKSLHIVPAVGAVFKSIATGVTAWNLCNKLCSKIPIVGQVTGGITGLITFTGSFFTQRKFLSLQGQKNAAPTETTGLLAKNVSAINGSV